MKKQIAIGSMLVLAAAARADFAGDVALLKKHNGVIVLSDKAGQAQVAVVPNFQGRVMTSTASGPKGDSFGWINKKAIAENKRQPHINVFGGEDRIWFGPEGGQFSIFFPKGAKFEFADWNTPAPIDWGAWPLLGHSREMARFGKTFPLVNYSGFRFEVRARRTVRLMDASALKSVLGAVPGKGVKSVGIETENSITNAGKTAWTKENGLLSIWVLGMFNPSPRGTVVIPFQTGDEAKLGPIVNDAYFGKVPTERLKVDAARGVLFFKADGKKRSKIGIPPARAKDIAGSYDGKTLTLTQFTLPFGARDYVNSMWEMQKNPFGGDAVNSYNDGPLDTGGQLGPFYELESSSPAAALQPNQTLTHFHRTIHLQGPAAELDKIARRKLGVSLAEISGALR